MSRLESVPSMRSSEAEVWYLKDIQFGRPGFEDKRYKIITQNFNGPCSFIAICNILILRGNIEILPVERRTVSYEFLSQLVAEYLLTSAPDVDISAALNIMPYTQQGMDLNPLFLDSKGFRPAGTNSGELDLFEKAGIQLVHGWLADPHGPEAEVVKRVRDYDHAVQLIAEADHLMNGKLLMTEDMLNAPSGSSSSPVVNYSKEESYRIEDAFVMRQFLKNTSSQLTYHGLFHLVTSLEPNTLYALFRNSHLSVVYKTEGEESALYTLVTDQVFLNEPAVVWERIEDVEGGSSTFVNSDFKKSIPVGGDFAGRTAEDAVREAEVAAGIPHPSDAELARYLQEEENHKAQLQRERHAKAEEHFEKAKSALEAQETAKQAKKVVKLQKKKDCIIM